MNTLTITRRNKLILSVGASMLALALLTSPVGRSSVASTLDWCVQTVDAVTEFPCRIATNIRHFSLDRLDPTCPQCF
ncbi:hypothetical protein [Terriglobus saanensis]|uniref:Uncharacterized protein n=1 Tax=Terriglobus saanensis (strain ATCC BAA-1853 / DSM 23119 / SP1PR4) TaxID=401053 RepID=E8V1A4_TERSS|nr:hypothetical protein [Terriglobus saanensis]ADV84519.1 protein of unknown function DUF58 [Terriglobus saanensis SP1PR4]